MPAACGGGEAGAGLIGDRVDIVDEVDIVDRVDRATGLLRFLDLRDK